MRWRCVRTPKGYSLVYTLLPSYTLPLFLLRGDDEAVKLHGWGAGAVLRLEDGLLCCRGCSLEELVSWGGLWSTIGTRLGVIGVSVSPWDDDLILAAIVASQNTSWRRVVAWMRTLAPLLESRDYAAARRAAESIGSYQAARAVAVHEAYVSRRLSVRAGGLWEARRRLMELPYVGVKTAHAYLLFTTHSGYPVPVDRHLLRAYGGSAPDPRLCARHPCPVCPARGSCTAWRLYRLYGWRAGAVQTRVWLESQSRRSIEGLIEAASRRRGAGT